MVSATDGKDLGRNGSSLVAGLAVGIVASGSTTKGALVVVLLLNGCGV